MNDFNEYILTVNPDVTFQKEYEFFMGDLVGNKELAKLTAFVEIN